MELLRHDIVNAAEERGGGGGGWRRELGDGDVHVVKGWVDGTWAAGAEEGATETWLPWMVGAIGVGVSVDGGCGLGGLGHLGP